MKHHHPDLRPGLVAIAIAGLCCMPAQAGTYEWSGGLFVPDVTAPQPLPFGSDLNIVAGGPKTFSNVGFDNQGSVNWYVDPLRFQSGSVIDNRERWQAFSDDSFVSAGGAVSTFNNLGTFRKAGGSGETTVSSVIFVNEGIVDAQTGSIVFNSPSTSFRVGTQFTGAGLVRMDNGATFTGSFSSANLVLNSGNFIGGDGSVGAEVVASGMTTLAGGSLIGGWQLAGGQTMRAVSGGSKVLSAVDFDNRGQLVWDTNDPLLLQSGSVVDNTGSLDLQQSTTMQTAGGALSTVDNRGTVSVGAGQTLSVAAVRFLNQGVGVLDVAGAIDFDGGNVELMNGTAVTGGGAVRLNHNATLHGLQTIADLQLTSGTLTANAVEHQGTLTWRGGNLSGQWQVPVGQVLHAVTGSNKLLTALALDNQGTVRWDTADALRLQSGTRFDNAGRLEFTQDVLLKNDGGAQALFDNSGVLAVAAGKTLSVDSVRFVNQGIGVIDAQGDIDFDGGVVEFMSGTTATGGGTLRLNHNATLRGTQHLPDLELNGGTLTADAVEHPGTLTWHTGKLSGQWQVPAGQMLHAVTGGNKLLTALALDNQGTVRWDTADALRLQSGTRFDNAGRLEFTQDVLLKNDGGAQALFDNRGVLAVAAGTTLSVDSVRFVNQGIGVIDAQGDIDFDGGVVEFMSGTTATGGGTLRLNHNATLRGTQHLSDLELNGGTLTADAVEHPGTLTWHTGKLSGQWQVPAGQMLHAVTGGNKLLTALALDNQGTVRWDTADALRLQSGTRFDSVGRLEFTQDALLKNDGGARPLFDNSGVLTVATGTTLSVDSVQFVNRGVGVIDAQGDVDFDGGVVELISGTTATGGGTLRLNHNATLRGTQHLPDLELTSGTLTADAVVHQGRLTWRGGVITGAWEVPTGSRVDLVDSSTKLLTQAQLGIDGELSIQSAQDLRLQTGTLLVNRGVIDLQADGGLGHAGGAASSVLNQGLIRKTGGVSSTIDNNLGFANTGVVDVRTGTLVLPTNFSNDGTLTGGGTLALTGTLSNHGHVAPGASPGMLAIDGSFAQSALGTLDIEIGTLASSDWLSVSGDVDLDGTLALHCHALCNLAVGDELLIVAAGGTLSTGVFASMTMSGFASGAFTPVYDLGAGEVRLLVADAVTAAIPEPGTWALWLAGLAALGGAARRRGRSAQQGRD